MEVNAFIVTVYERGECIFKRGPYKIINAIEIYDKCLRRYFNGFETNKHLYLGYFSLSAYSNGWLEKIEQQMTREEFENHVRGIYTVWEMGHMRIEFFHEFPKVKKAIEIEQDSIFLGENIIGSRNLPV